VGSEPWRDLTEADPHLLVRLRLFGPTEGAPNRPRQSGFHARWLLDPHLPDGAGRLVLADPLQRCLLPGQETIVRVHSTHLELSRAWDALRGTAGSVAIACSEVMSSGGERTAPPHTWPGIAEGSLIGLYGRHPRRASRRGSYVTRRKLGEGTVLARVGLP
jgi:hypothetical protein